MRLRDVMTHSVISLHPQQTIAEAMHAFVRHKVKGAPVLEDSVLVGIISEKDIFRALYPSMTEYYDNPELWLEEAELEGNARGVLGKKVHEIMTRQPITAPPDIPVMQAGALLLAHRVHRIVVVDGQKVVGIATRSDIFRAVFKKFL